jgi:iron complex outermembrane receptor protein
VRQSSVLVSRRRRRGKISALRDAGAWPVIILLGALASPAAVAQSPAAPPATAPIAPDLQPLSGAAVPLPTVTVEVRKPKSRRRTATQVAPAPSAPAAAPPQTPPPRVVVQGGPPVMQTTAGPVSGYRALTSVSATKTDTPIEQIPQAIAVLPRAVIDDQHPLTQSEAFRNISAVTGTPPNQSVGNAFKVRGFPADRYVDGLPNYWDGGDFLSLVNTERIEVLKGPAGILYQGGFGPVGGIINSVSKLPTAVPSAETGIMAGGFGLWNPWFDVNGPVDKAGNVLFRMTGDFERSRDYVDVIDRQRYSLNPTLRLDDHDGTALTVQGRFTSREMQAYSGLPGAGTVDRSVFTTRPSLFPTDPNVPETTSTYDGVTVRLDHEINGFWSMNAAARVSQTRLREFEQFPSSPNPALSATPLFGSTFIYLNNSLLLDTREIASNVNFIAKGALGPTRNVLLLGADDDAVADKLGVGLGFDRPMLIDLANPAFPAFVMPPTNTVNADNTYRNSGFTAQLQSDVWERLHLLAGLRLAHVHMHGADMVAQTNFVSDAWKPLPRAGAVLDLVPGISVFADYSEGFRGVPFFAGTPGTAPKPEEAAQIEGGLKLALPYGFSGTLSYFDITRRNVMNLQPGAPFLAVQIGAQRSRGFDMDLIWQPIAGLSIIGSYAHIDAFLVQDQLYPAGNKLDRVPADSGRVWANYKFQSGPLRNVSVGAGFYAASRQAAALDNLYFTPAFITFDAKIAYEADNWSVALVGKNLADRRYFEPFPIGLGLIAPGQPLTVYVVATIKR